MLRKKIDLISRIKDIEKQGLVFFLLLIAGIILALVLPDFWKLTCLVPWTPAAIWGLNAFVVPKDDG